MYVYQKSLKKPVCNFGLSTGTGCSETCGISHLGNMQKLSARSPGQPALGDSAWTLGDLLRPHPTSNILHV